MTSARRERNVNALLADVVASIFFIIPYKFLFDNLEPHQDRLYIQ